MSVVLKIDVEESNYLQLDNLKLEYECHDDESLLSKGLKEVNNEEKNYINGECDSKYVQDDLILTKPKINAEDKGESSEVLVNKMLFENVNFSSKYNLKRKKKSKEKMISIINEYVFPCKSCKRVFANEKNLSEHTCDCKYLCDLCGIRLKSILIYQNHYWKIHRKFLPPELRNRTKNKKIKNVNKEKKVNTEKNHFDGLSLKDLLKSENQKEYIKKMLPSRKNCVSVPNTNLNADPLFKNYPKTNEKTDTETQNSQLIEIRSELNCAENIVFNSFDENEL